MTSFTQKLECLLDRNDVIENDNKIPETERNGVLFSPHPAYPALSSSIEIKYEEDRGRFGVASRNIKVGEVLLFESPTSATIKRSYEKDHCVQCLRYVQ